jgi:serine/threonine-protein kinase
MSDFLIRLRQRKLVQWALAYIAASFALIQVIDIVAQRFGWPEQTVRFVIIALAVGFFITLVLAWYHGERGAQRVTGTELLILAVLLAIGGGAIWKFAPESTSPAATASRAAAVDAKSIAVLPFESLSEEKDNAYFASGMQDMILTKLAGIGDLKVISRTSTEKYKSHPENLAVIGKELGVASILEGTVQKAGNQVLINLQLIDASNDNHLWAQDYTRTLENIFGVEGEVAEKVAGALRVVLTRDERNTLALKPTQNAEALDAYLRGLAMQSQPAFGVAQATDEFQKAVTLDPNFTLAWTELFWQRLRAYWFGFDATATNLDAANAAFDRATALAPDLPQVERARAQYLYFLKRDFAGASAVMRQVQRGLPNDERTWFFSALVERRVGAWDAVVADLRKAQSLAPMDPFIYYELANTAVARRHFDEAVTTIETAPEFSEKSWGAEMHFFATLNLGGVDATAKLLERFAATGVATADLRPWQALLQRDFKAAVPLFADAIVRAAGRPQPNYQSEYFVAAYLPATIGWQLQQAFCEKRSGATDAADTLYSAVQKNAQAALAKKEVNPNIEAAWHVTLALADAGLGEHDNAVAEAQRAVALIPESNDRFEGPYWQDYLAQVYAMNGDAAHAVPIIKHLVDTSGSTTTRAMLKVDPVWDPIRDDAGFKALLIETPR